MTNKTGLDPIWRGAVGGAIGAPIFLGGVIVRDLLTRGSVPYSGVFEIMALPVFTFVGVIFGALLGSIFWVLLATTGVKLPAVIRAVIGIGLFLLVRWFATALKGDTNRGPATPFTPETVLMMLLFVGSLGALPGLLARPRGGESGSEF